MKFVWNPAVLMALLAPASSSQASAFSTLSKGILSSGRPSFLSAHRHRQHHRLGRPSFLFTRGGALMSTTTVADAEETTSATLAQEEPTTSSTTSTSAYQQLVQKWEAITHLGRAQAVLGYDQQVFMPASASAERGAQLAALATVLHQQRTDPQLLELMDQALVEASSSEQQQQQQQQQLQPDELRLLELERKAFVENARVPSTLAAKAAQLSSSAYSDWVKAREAKDFSMFEATLQDCFDTAMQLAAAKQGSSENLYDFMLDDFEIGMSQTRIDAIFEQVESTLVPLIQKVLSSSHPPSTAALQGEFDMDAQHQLSDRLVKAIGFNAEQGRIDVSVHPFTSSMSPSDVRITSRFRTDEWYQGLAGSLHEGGHAIYEQSLPNSALSIDTALSMGTHESQSLFWERHVGLSKAFWKYATPILHDTLAGTKEYSDQDIYGAINAMSEKSLIRVEADELSYPLHVILRYNIEKDVIGGKLQVSDIPERWNADMKRYLNVEVPSDDKGCLQDVHWSALAFGYFPTYLIGAIASAQLFHYCQKDIPDIEQQMEKGEFGVIKGWLTNKVHRHGRRYKSLDALLEDQLGEPLNPQYFLDYLTEKYSDLYQL